MTKRLNITTTFEEVVTHNPHQTALRFRNLSLSYGELNRKANRLARYLQEKGVRFQDVVGISLERSPELITALLAILKLGAVYLPIDAAYPEERKGYMIQDAKPKVILTQADFQHTFPIDETNLEIKTAPSDLAYINYTSGSTGRPKGVEICHQGVLRLVKNSSWLPVTPEDRFLQFATISFDASTLEIWAPLLNGAALILYPQKELSIDLLEKVMFEEEITHFDCTPAVFNLLTDERINLFRSTRVITVGGDVLSPQHASRLCTTFPTCRLFNTYGPTENTCLTTVYEITDPKAIQNGVPIGRPIDETTVYILDEFLKPALEGELYTGGMGLARGYLNAPELTIEKFIPNPFGPGKLYKTGDLVRLLPDGNIGFIGRIDSQIKLRGFRIEPAEIENVLREQNGVSDSAVLLKDGILIAYVTVQKGATLSEEELKEFIAAKLPSYMLPSLIHILDHFPLTSNGKLDRKALPSPAEILSHRTVESPQTPTEERLTHIWAHFFGLPKVGRNDDFFELGGDSIDAVEMGVMMSAPVNWLFQHSTLEKYAKRLDQEEVETAPQFILWRDEEATLDPNIQSPKNSLPPSQYEKPPKIFLTGATGFVGAFFLRELLETTSAQVYCLVRDKNLKKTLQKYRIWKSEYENRIIECLGDLEKPKLGLSPDLFTKLGTELDSIFHIGAYVNHALPYHKLKAANVLGTQEAIRLAMTGTLKPFHHISTVDVLEPKDENPVDEDIDIDTCQNLPTGYAQSKWIAEKLVLEARKRGLPANIYRLSRVAGHSEIGAGSTTDFLWRTIQACLKLKKTPHMNFKEEMTPVDYISKAIRYISTKASLINHTFHILDKELYNYKDLFGYLEKLGYASKTVDFADWKKSLEEQAIRTQEGSLMALLSMFPDKDASPTSYSNSRLLNALKNTTLFCPKLSEELFKKYVSFFVDIGFLNSANNT